MTRVLVYGFGISGRATVAYLAGRGDDVVVVDDAPGPSTAADVEDAGGRLAAPAALEEILGSVDLVVPSPGVPAGHRLFGLADAAAVEVRSEIELGAQALAARPEPRPLLAAITGTNGKTTVTSWVAHLLQQAGRRAIAAGNIGRPLVDAAGADADVIVVEVSSFQLQRTATFHPQVTCWLNLAADHLDWHPSMEHYTAAKARIWSNQAAGDTAVINADDPAVTAAASLIPPGVHVLTFSLGPADYTVLDGWLVGPEGVRLAAVATLPRALPHDLANALAAAAVARASGVDDAAVKGGLAEIPLLPHRVTLVAEIGGVRWYDDSKATTPASVLAAVAGFDSVVLIAGGRNKGLDLSVLAESAPPVRAAVAIGEAAGEVERALAGQVPVCAATCMAEAVAAAESISRPGDAVLLSPGCASFDWYQNYAARGDDFSRLVRAHLEKGDRPC